MPNEKLKHNLKFLVLFLALSGSAYCQSTRELTYDIVKGGKNIGFLNVSRQSFGDSLVYQIESRVEIRFLFSFVVHFRSTEISVGGRLVEGKAKSTLNGKIQKESNVWLSNDEFFVNLNGATYEFGNKIVDYFVSQLYFIEPKERKQIFSQQFANYIDLERTGEHTYTLISPDGNNYYIYENGNCKQVKISRDFATFYFKLKDVKESN